MTTLTGVVLTGGRSSRMGRDKAQLRIGDQTLIEMAISRLQSCCGEVWISARAGQKLPEGVQRITDEKPDEGPLVAILHCLRILQRPLLVTAVDLPALSTDDVGLLADSHLPEHRVTAYYDTALQQWEGLVSIWEPAVLPELELFVTQGGRSVGRFLHQINATRVAIRIPDHFLNLNAPKDLNQFLSR